MEIGEKVEGNSGTEGSGRKVTSRKRTGLLRCYIFACRERPHRSRNPRPLKSWRTRWMYRCTRSSTKPNLLRRIF